MVRKRSLAWCLVAFGLCSSVIAADPAEEVKARSQSLGQVMQQEAEGRNVDRRQLCELATSKELDESIAWQAGLIRIHDKWMPVEELNPSCLDDDAYFEKRAELIGKPAANLKLARWCQRKQLHDLARAHFGAVLCVAPNHLEARKYFGHVRVGEQWYSQDDVARAQKQAQAIVEGLKVWVPKLRPIAKQIRSTSTAISVRGLKDLEKINDPLAIPALELFACDADEDLAKLCINKIASFESPLACQALMRIAIAREVSDAREAAIVALLKYPEQAYVPELLNSLSSEVVVQGRWVARPDGNLALSMLVGKELRGKKLVKQVNNFVNVISTFSSTANARIGQSTEMKDSKFYSNMRDIPVTSLQNNTINFNSNAAVAQGAQSLKTSGNVASASNAYVPREVNTAAAFNMREQGKQQMRIAESFNREQRQYTERVCSLLRRLSGEDHPNEPTVWWNWWNDRYERLESTKPIQTFRQNNRSQIAMHSHTSAAGQENLEVGVTGQMYQWSCLVPGTLIQTQSGLVPIESIQIGDRVVSKNVETGEVALKPVVMTTVRPPKTTIKIMTEQDTINATGGHIWWVSGEGWTRANELEPGMLLHTVTGTAEIKSIDKNKEKIRTHNLVVDEFNTYFVGTQRVLSYDNTLVRPTLKKVPGYEKTP